MICSFIACEALIENGLVDELAANEEYESSGFYMVYQTGIKDVENGEIIATPITGGRFEGCWRSVETGSVFTDVVIA